MSAQRLQRGFWLGLAVLCPALPLHAYFAGSWYSVLHSYSLGMLFGIVSYVWFANTLILAARIRLFDRLFGHDRVMVFHGRLAAAALVFAFAHALLKGVYYGLAGAQVALGLVALVLFSAVALVTLLFMVRNILHRLKPIAVLRAFCVRRIGFDYSRLKLFHNVTAPAMALVTVHVLMAAPTAETRARLGLMAGWGGLSLLLWCGHKFVRVVLRYRRCFLVQSVRRLNDTTVALGAARPDGSLLRHRAGQFAFFRVLAACCGRAEHPFTISSPPGAKTLGITVKALGDYSAALAAVPVGAKLLCDGPYGRFTPERDARPYLFVAGGIGITPFLSILRKWDGAGFAEPVTLIWSARTRADLIDGATFEALAERHAAFNYVPVLTREQDKRVDRELLAAHVDPASVARIAAYVCGPDALRRTVTRCLRELGVANRAIFYESFAA